jgi:hypothetical protein
MCSIDGTILQVFHKKLWINYVTYHQATQKNNEVFEWTKQCQNAWEDIKNWYTQALIMINLNWELEFHVQTYAFQLILGAILVQNPTRKFDQLVIYIRLQITKFS